MTGDDKLRHFAKQWVETARGLKRFSELPAMREQREGLQRWQQLIGEAEFEADMAAETTSPAPASETATPTATAPARAAAEPQITADDVFREEIRTINKEAEARGDKYWPNGKEASQLARDRLGVRGINDVDRNRGDDIAGEDEFKTKRRRPGQHS
jgi:hypothetical protein